MGGWEGGRVVAVMGWWWEGGMESKRVFEGMRQGGLVGRGKGQVDTRRCAPPLRAPPARAPYGADMGRKNKKNTV